MKLPVLRIRDFSGGFNDYADRYNLQANEAQDCLNVLCDAGGALVRRTGKVAYGTTPQTNPWEAVIGRGLFRAYSDQAYGGQAAKVLIGKHTSTMRYGTDTTGAGNSLKTGLSTSSRMRCVQWGDRCAYIALDGFGATADTDDHPYCWPLATATTNQCLIHQMGVVAPTAPVGTPSVSATAGTATQGYYRYAITVTYGPDGSWGESLPVYTATYKHWDAGDGAFTAGDPSLKKYTITGMTALTGWDSSVGAYKRRIYRSEYQTTDADATKAPCYFLMDVSLAGTTLTAYDDTEYTVDITQGAPTTATTGDIPYTYARVFAVHHSRLWGVFAGGSSTGKTDRVYYSNLYKPDEWPTGNFIDVNGRISGLCSAPFGLLIFTQAGVTIVEGQSLADLSASVRRVEGAPGCISIDSVANIIYKGQSVVAYAALDGIYYTDGQGAYLLGATADGRANKCGHSWQVHATNNASQKGNAQGIAWQGYYLLAYQDDRTTGSYNNRVLMFDTRTDSWWPFTGWNVAAWAMWNGPGDADELYFITSDASGFIYRVFTGTESSAITWQTGDLAPAGIDVRVQFPKVQLELSHDLLPLTLNVEVDRGLQTAGPYTIPAPAAGSEDNTPEQSLPINCVGNRVSAKITQTGTSTEPIIGIGLEYRVRG